MAKKRFALSTVRFLDHFFDFVKVGLGKPLVFGELKDNVIPGSGILEWSGENLENIECVSEFVVMYREDKVEAESEREVLCPGYRITNVGEVFSCEYNLTTTCGARVEILLEAWTEGRMVQPAAKVLVNCYQDIEPVNGEAEFKEGDNEKQEEKIVEEDDNDVVESSGSDEENWAFPLVLASLQAFSKATRGNSTIRGCEWGGWSAWSSCSVTCGGAGRRRRTRGQVQVQGGKRCKRKQEEAKKCQTNLCPVDCRLSSWGPWSPCSLSCGSGFRSRTRSVVQEALHGGLACPTNREHQETCVEEDCAVDGAWTSWTRWAYCSTTCGPGNRTRSRTCTAPSPQNGGLPCVGPSHQTSECTISLARVCPPVDGQWSLWSPWTACSTPCGPGERQRMRSCTRYLPLPPPPP